MPTPAKLIGELPKDYSNVLALPEKYLWGGMRFKIGLVELWEIRLSYLNSVIRHPPTKYVFVNYYQTFSILLLTKEDIRSAYEMEYYCLRQPNL